MKKKPNNFCDVDLYPKIEREARRIWNEVANDMPLPAPRDCVIDAVYNGLCTSCRDQEVRTFSKNHLLNLAARFYDPSSHTNDITRRFIMRWHIPCDPDCPIVNQFMTTLFEDPLTSAYGAPTDDIIEGFENVHKRTCHRCRLFVAANIEVI